MTMEDGRKCDAAGFQGRREEVQAAPGRQAMRAGGLWSLLAYAVAVPCVVRVARVDECEKAWVPLHHQRLLLRQRGKHSPPTLSIHHKTKQQLIFF